MVDMLILSSLQVQYYLHSSDIIHVSMHSEYDAGNASLQSHHLTYLRGNSDGTVDLSYNL